MVKEGISVHICTKDDMHPYECDSQTCIHCNRKTTDRHNPEKCWLCCDGDPDQPKEPQ